ncbi:MAG: hypothetical protein QM489_05175 [Candidatus Izemoplasma sp.]
MIKLNPFTKYEFKNKVILRNKIVMAPMTTYSGNPDLTLSTEEEAYYHKFSAEVGMVITAAVAVSKNAQAFPFQTSARSDFYIDSLTRLANAIKSSGAKAIMQIHHGGRMNLPNLFIGQKIVAPSSIKALRENLEKPIELSSNEINLVIKDFKEATIRAIKAGFDGVEIHGANTYLVQQFYSSQSNTRTDSWGVKLKFPLRLTDEIIKTVKRNTSKPFIVGYRFSPEELEKDGITVRETVTLVKELVKRDIDYLHISLGKYDQTSLRNTAEKSITGTVILDAIRGKVPLIGVGAILDLKDLESAFELGYDLCAIGTGLLADCTFVSNLKTKKGPNKTIDLNMLPSGLKTRMLNAEDFYNSKGFTYQNK